MAVSRKCSSRPLIASVGPARGAGRVEVGQHVRGTLLQRMAEFRHLGHGRGNVDADRVDERDHEAVLLAAVLMAARVDDARSAGSSSATAAVRRGRRRCTLSRTTSSQPHRRHHRSASSPPSPPASRTRQPSTARRAAGVARRPRAELSMQQEGRRVGTGEPGTRGSVEHVEIFRMGSVRVYILEAPRCLSRDRRAQPDPHTMFGKSHIAAGVRPGPDSSKTCSSRTSGDFASRAKSVPGHGAICRLGPPVAFGGKAITELAR